MVGKNRNWMLTFFRIPQLDVLENAADSKSIAYFVGQNEMSPTTNRLHWQCYVEFTKPMTLRQVKDVMEDNTVHAEPRRGTQEQAIRYCTKEATRVDEPFSFGKPKNQGKRSDIADIMDDIADGSTIKEILTDHGGNALRMIHCIEKSILVHHGFSSIDNWIISTREMHAGLRTGNVKRFANAQEARDLAEQEIGVKRLLPDWKPLRLSFKNVETSNSSSDSE